METQRIDQGSVRPSPIAGTWYPGSPDVLRKTVDDLLAHAEYFPTDDELIMLISPHAGYPYSGQTAAYAYRQLENRRCDLVILLGPSHHAETFDPFVVTAKKYYSTPLALAPVATDFVEALAHKVPLVQVERDQEHSLEIQLPFLQRMLKDFRLVPLMLTIPFYIVGAHALEPCERLAGALVDLVRGQDSPVLFVASSDLSHLPDYAAVNSFDARTAELVEAFDIPGLAQYMWRDLECRACGDAPIITGLLAAKKLGATRAQVLYRTNSGDVTGVRTRGQYTVGYMAAGVYKGA